MKKIVLLWVMIIGCVVNNGCFALNNSKLKDVDISREQTGKNIFSFKKEIGMTDEQENKIKALIYDIQQSLGTNKSKLDTLTIELSRMIKNKESMRLIRKKLEEISKIQIESTYTDIEIGRKIEDVLSSDQLKKWNAIKEREANVKKA